MAEQHPKKKQSRFYDLPDALDEEESDLSSTPEKVSEITAGGTPSQESKEAQKGESQDAPNTSKKEGQEGSTKPDQKGIPEDADSDEQPDPISDDEIAHEPPATDDEISTTKTRSDESDMGKDFCRYAKAAEMGQEEIQKRAYDLEMKIHNIDASQKTRLNIWASPIVHEILDTMAEQLGVPKSEVILCACVMFYRNCLTDERRMLHDLGFLLDNLALQNQELCMETSSLEDLAQQAIELEASPYFSPDEKELDDMEDYDYSQDNTKE